MNVLLTVIGGIIIAVVISLLVFLIAMSFRVLTWFYGRKCKYCKHCMDYRGLKEDESNGHYLFHCPKCDAWEQVPREQIYYWLSNDKNEQNNK